MIGVIDVEYIKIENKKIYVDYYKKGTYYKINFEYRK